MAERRRTWSVYNQAVVSEIEKPEEMVGLFLKAAESARDLLREYERLRDRLGQAEEESVKFAERHAKVEQQLELLQNLFVSLHRLHATLSADDVLLTIKEILTNFVGAQRFAIWLANERGEMTLVDQEGFHGDVPVPDPAMVRGVSAIVPSDAEPTWVGFRPSGQTKTLAMVPLRVAERQIGLIVIYALFKQKDGFNSIDAQVFELLSEQGGTALMAARLYEASQGHEK